ncbi:hypothetical protein BDR04DRAFT_1118616 [Suillus decipiens]|nr:hypothetical protein BDR04DRAFT_1118616 [Suillus decipiens]
MSNSSTLSTHDITDFTIWDATNILDHVPRTPAYKVCFVRHLQWEADPMGAMLSLGPVVTGQVKGDPLLNQILAVTACMKHLGKSLTSLLEEKPRMAAEAANTMSQLEGLMGELEEVPSKAQRQFVSQ